MNAPWFHHHPLPAVGATAALQREEAKHALGARRLGAGDPVVLFDGHGGIAHATLEGQRDRQGEVLARVERTQTLPRGEPAITLGVALPKGDRLSTLLDMVTQLGVAQIVPLQTAYGVIDPAVLNRERAERIMLEACKQSRNPWLPVLAPGATLAQFIGTQRAAGAIALLAHPGGAQLAASLAAAKAAPLAAAKAAPLAAAKAAPLAIAIGPEGGFSEAELAAAVAAGAVRVSLGNTILRIETAAVALCAAIRLAQ